MNTKQSLDTGQFCRIQYEITYLQVLIPEVNLKNAK